MTPKRTLTPSEFQQTWVPVDLKERAAVQSHFNDLCALVGHDTPHEMDPKGEFFTFEKGVEKASGGSGWADVWFKGHFAWEYKGRGRKLEAAFKQLLEYKDKLGNPPLLVVCDIDRVEIHTNFTGTVPETHVILLNNIDKPESLEKLRWLFYDVDKFCPQVTLEQATEEAAREFCKLADDLRNRGIDPEAAASFLTKLLFCMFAEDVQMFSDFATGLPVEPFTYLVQRTIKKPEAFKRRLRNLFQTMATGGDFGPFEIDYFNGGLFENTEVLDLTTPELRMLEGLCRLNWSHIEPTVFGTLFERTLDPGKRSQIGAHYTSKKDILKVVEPVLMIPLQQEWAEVRANAEKLRAEHDAIVLDLDRGGSRSQSNGKNKRVTKKDLDDIQTSLRNLYSQFLARLKAVRVFDPACGSGNFLYVALQRMKDLEREVLVHMGESGLTVENCWNVAPEHFLGLDINPYAVSLAQVVLWIGYFQWMREHGFPPYREPLIAKGWTIQHRDAILDLSDPANPKEPEWPECDVIIGNPPFLGGKKLRAGLDDVYVDALFKVYGDRVPAEADLCCYWFEKGRDAIEKGRCLQAGLLATNSIRGGANRKVLDRITEDQEIFMAWSDNEWILDGAAVRISIIGFGHVNGYDRVLDGTKVSIINPDLTGGLDMTDVHRLRENAKMSFMGDTKQGPFDISHEVAISLLSAPNPHGRPNSDVLKRWVDAFDLVRRDRNMWIIDYNAGTSYGDACLYEAPFRLLETLVKPSRAEYREAHFRDVFWLHHRPRPDMRRALAPLRRYLATPRVSKYRVFVWLNPAVLADSATIVFARSDDYFMGVLQSRPHELWALRLGTSLEDRPRYTPTTTFETFPLPWSPGSEPQPKQPGRDLHDAIAAAAQRLNELRENWLNPPEWVIFEPPPVEGYPPRILPKDETVAKELAKRTLTNLYNQRPPWLVQHHETLDKAVFAAYGWEWPLTDDEILKRLLELNHERAQTKSTPLPPH